MSAKHTPGPWKVYDPEMPYTKATYGIDGPQGQAVVYFGITHNDGINLLADASLIAAAPELLAALQAGPSTEHALPFGNVCSCSQCEFVRLRRAAIAKAIG